MRALVVLSLGVIIALAGWRTAPANAAACADFPDQAAAQRAGDTRDADEDGIYCEALPCPCLRSGRGGAAPRFAPSHPARRRGAGRAPAPVLGRAACRRGPRADPRCTPGASFARATREQVCTPGYAARAREVSQSDKDRIYAAYGIVSHRPREYEVDHLIALELGGSNSARNLWPQRYGGPDGAGDKDGLEDRLHAEVCAGQITLARAQRESVARWTMGVAPAARARGADRPASQASHAPDRAQSPTSRPSAPQRSGSTLTGLAYAVLLLLALLLVGWRRRRMRA